MRSVCHLCNVRGLTPSSAARGCGSTKSEPTTRGALGDADVAFMVVEYRLAYYTEMGSKRGQYGTTRVVIERPLALRYNEGRYAAAKTPPRVNWPAKLESLRSGDFDGKHAEANARSLLKGCGYVMTPGNTAPLLERLRTVQRTICLLFDAEENAVGKAWKYRADCKRLLDATLNKTPAAPVVTNRKMQDWMQEHPSAGKPEGARANLIASVTDYALENRIPRERMAGYAPLPRIEYPAAPYPDAILRKLLEFTVADGIDTRLTFDKDCVPVVLLTPRDPIAALLLQAHESTTLRAAVQTQWGTCEWCGRLFPKRRRDARACCPTHRENLKKNRQRARRVLRAKGGLPKSRERHL